VPLRGNVQRYFIDGIGPDAVRAGYKWLRSFAREGLHSSAAIFVHGVQDIHNLAAGLGVARARKLDKDRMLTEGGLNVSVATTRSLSSHAGPLLAVWVTDEDLLDRLDRWQVPALCAIPWDGAPDWKARWRPIDVRTGRELPEAPQIVANAVVVEALDDVTTMANLSNGLDSYNRGMLAQAFVALHREGEGFDPEQIRAWTAPHGWGASNARKIAHIAQSAIDGRRVRAGTSLRSDSVDHWRSRADSDHDDSG
jgi:hypothetical protein